MVQSTLDAAPSGDGLLGSPQSGLALRIRGTERDGQIVRLNSTKCAVGSGPNCALRLRARGVHSVHCLILRGRDGTYVRRYAPDTRLNGAFFTDSPLLPGDRLGIGPLEFEVLPPEVTNSNQSTSCQSLSNHKTHIEERLQVRQAGHRRILKLIGKIRNQQQKLQSLSAKLESQKNLETTLRTQLQKLEEDLASRQRQNDTAETDKEKATKENSDLLRKIDELKLQLEQEKQKLTRQKETGEQLQFTLNEEIRQSRLQLENLQAENEKLHQQQQNLDRLTDDLESKTNLETELRSRLLKLEKDLANHQQGHASENETLERSQREYQELVQSNEELSRLLDLERQKLTHQQEETDRLKSSLEQEQRRSEQELETLQTENEELRNQQKNLDRLKIDLEAQKDLETSLRNQLQQAEEDLANGRKQSDLEKDDKEKYSRENEELHKTVEELNQLLEQEKQCLSRQKEDWSSLRDRLEQDVKQRNQELEEIKRENKVLSDQSGERQSEMQQENSAAEEILQQKSAELELSLRQFSEEKNTWQNQRDRTEQELIDRAENLDEESQQLEQQRQSVLREKKEWDEEKQRLSEEMEQLRKKADVPSPTFSSGLSTEKFLQSGPAEAASPLSLIDQLNLEAEPSEDCTALLTPRENSSATEQAAYGIDNLMEGANDLENELPQGQSTISEEQPRSVTEAVSDDQQDEAEETIEAYMARLLKRSSENKHRESTPENIQVLEEVPEIISEPEAEHEENLTNEEAAIESPETPAEEYVRSMAPERSSDLRKMRELANQTFRGALDHHIRRRWINAVLGKLAVSLVALVCGLLLWSWTPDRNSGSYFGALAGFVISTFWGLQAAILAKRIFLKPAKEKEATD